MSEKALEKFVEGLLEMAEKDGLMPWQRCTLDGIAGTDWPRNAATGRTYRGGNWVWLRFQGAEYWAGAKQWATLGAKIVDEDAKAWILAPANRIPIEKPNGEKAFIATRWRGVKVYPVTAVEGWTPPAKPEVTPVAPIDAAEAIIDGMPNKPTVKLSDIAETGSYSPTLDVVTMPLRDHCISAERFYKTYFHELAHATGHEARCKRDQRGLFDHEAYGREELVAEFTAAFLAAECGIHDATVENSAAYIKHWKDAIQADPKMLVSACSAAQTAADYIRNVKPEEYKPTPRKGGKRGKRKSRKGGKVKAEA